MLAVDEALCVIPELDVKPADRVQRAGLPGRVVGDPEQFDGLLSVLKPFPVAALSVEHPGQGPMRTCLARLVTKGLVELKSPPQVLISGAVAVKAAVGAGETAMDDRLCGQVTKSLGSFQGSVVRGSRVVPMTVAVQVRRDSPGKLPGVDIEAIAHRLAECREQNLALGREPGQSASEIGESLGCHKRLQRCQRDGVVAAWVKQLVCGVCGVQVVIEYSMDRQAPLGFGVVGRGKLTGVRAKQVVQREPAGSPFGEQMSADQVSELPTGLRQRYTSQACRGGGSDIRSRMQPKQPEQPGRRCAERLVGPGKHGTDIGVLIAAIQRVEAAVSLAQCVSQRRKRQPGVRCGVGRRDGQR